ncbi:MAG: hypothetical protein HFF02_06685 [Erysipelotrichaceae bacterium]|nr:hypothetical protein [Erysipelotrichaceae bacterium]
MIKEALQYVARLATDSQEIVTKEINGETYIRGDARRIPVDEAKALYLSSLSATVDLIQTNLKSEKFQLPYIIEIKDGNVIVHSGLNDRLGRNALSYTQPTLPNIEFGRYMAMEKFIIQLKTCFVETDNLNRLAAMVSTITDKSEVKVEDDGFSMTVSQTSGTTIKKAEELHVNPIVRLAPYRTFCELEQPESKFLLRVRDGGEMALFEADGGMWKLEAQERISYYLRQALKSETESQLVVVLG